MNNRVWYTKHIVAIFFLIICFSSATMCQAFGCSVETCYNDIDDYCTTCLSGTLHTGIDGNNWCCAPYQDTQIHSISSTTISKLDNAASDTHMVSVYLRSGQVTIRPAAFRGGITYGNEMMMPISSPKIRVTFLTDTRFAVGYKDNSFNYVRYFQINTDLSLTQLAEVQMYTSNPSDFFIDALDDTRVMVVYRNVDNNVCYVRVCDQSLCGSATQFAGSNKRYCTGAALSADKFVVAYRDEGNGNAATVTPCTTTGTSISKGSSWSSNIDTEFVSIIGLSSTQFFLLAADHSDSDRGKGVLCSVSGTSISACSGSTTIDSNPTTYASMDNFNDTHFIVATGGVIKLCKKTGATSFSCGSDIKSSLTLSNQPSVAAIGNYHGYVADTTDQGESRVFTMENTNKIFMGGSRLWDDGSGNMCTVVGNWVGGTPDNPCLSSCTDSVCLVNGAAYCTTCMGGVSSTNEFGHEACCVAGADSNNYIISQTTTSKHESSSADGVLFNSYVSNSQRYLKAGTYNGYPAFTGTELGFGSNPSQFGAKILSPQHFVVVYYDTKLNTRVGIIGADLSLSFPNAEVQLDSASVSNLVVDKISDTKYVVFYKRGSARANICEIVNDAPVCGPAQIVSNDASGDYMVAGMSNSQFAATFINDNIKGRITICSFSGTTISGCLSESQYIGFEPVDTYLYRLDDTSVVVGALKNQDFDCSVTVCRDNGGSISCSSSNNFGTISSGFEVVGFNSSHFATVYKKSGSGKIKICKYTGSISCGPEQTFDSNNVNDLSITRIDDSHALITYTNSVGTAQARIITATSTSSFVNTGAVNWHGDPAGFCSLTGNWAPEDTGDPVQICTGCTSLSNFVCVPDCAAPTCLTNTEEWCSNCAISGTWHSVDSRCCSRDSGHMNWCGVSGRCNAGFHYSVATQSYCEGCNGGDWQAERCCHADDANWCDSAGKTGACVEGSWDFDCGGPDDVLMDTFTPTQRDAMVVQRENGRITLLNDFITRPGTIDSVVTLSNVYISSVTEGAEAFETEKLPYQCNVLGKDNYLHVSPTEIYVCPALDLIDQADNLIIDYMATGTDPTLTIRIDRSNSDYENVYTGNSLLSASSTTPTHVEYDIPLTRKYCSVCDTSSCTCSTPATCTTTQFCSLCFSAPADSQQECNCVGGHWDAASSHCCSPQGTTDFCGSTGFCEGGYWNTTIDSPFWCANCGNGEWSTNETRCCSTNANNWCGIDQRCEGGQLRSQCSGCDTCSAGACTLECSGVTCALGSAPWCASCATGDPDTSEHHCLCDNLNNVWMQDSSYTERCCGDDGLGENWIGQGGAICQNGAVVYTNPWCVNASGFTPLAPSLSGNSGQCRIDLTPTAMTDTVDAITGSIYDSTNSSLRICIDGDSSDSTETDLDMEYTYQFGTDWVVVNLRSFTRHTVNNVSTGISLLLTNCFTNTCSSTVSINGIINEHLDTYSLNTSLIQINSPRWCTQCASGTWSASDRACCGSVNSSWCGQHSRCYNEVLHPPCSQCEICSNGNCTLFCDNSTCAIGSPSWCAHCAHPEADTSEAACSCASSTYHWINNILNVSECCGDDGINDNFGNNITCCINGTFMSNCNYNWCTDFPDQCRWCVDNIDLCEFSQSFELTSLEECHSDTSTCTDLKQWQDQCDTVLLDNTTFAISPLDIQSQIIIDSLAHLNNLLSFNLPTEKEDVILTFISQYNSLLLEAESIHTHLNNLQRLGITVDDAQMTMSRVYTLFLEEMETICGTGDIADAAQEFPVIEQRINNTIEDFTSIETVQDVSNKMDLIKSTLVDFKQSDDQDAYDEAIDALEMVINNGFEHILTSEEYSDLFNDFNQIKDATTLEELEQGLETLSIPAISTETFEVDLSNMTEQEKILFSRYNIDNNLFNNLEGFEISAIFKTIEISSKDGNRTQPVMRLQIKNNHNATQRNVRIPFKFPNMIEDIKETRYFNDLIIVDPDPLIVWDINELTVDEQLNMDFIVNFETCKSGIDCPTGAFCAGMANGMGLCKTKCKNCGTSCDTGDPATEICSHSGKCIQEGSLDKESACKCNNECNTGYCAINTCCFRHEFSNTFKHTCSSSPSLFRDYIDNIVLSLEEKIIVPVDIYNVMKKPTLLKVDIPHIYSPYVRGPPSIYLKKSENKYLYLEFFGVRPGEQPVVISLSNDAGTIKEQLRFNVFTTTFATPLGIRIKTVPDLNMVNMIVLLVLSSLFVYRVMSNKKMK